MGQVAVTFKIMPEGPESNIETIKKGVEKAVRSVNNDLKDIKEIPIGFGLVVLEVLVVMNDGAGMDKLENAISSVSGVASVEAGDVTLL